MWILLILACIVIPYACFRFLILRLQRFAGTHELFNERQKEAPTAIVLGESEFSQQVGRLLEDEGIHVTLMPDPDIQSPKQTFHYLFALSLNDVDNVLMCRIGEKVYHIKKFISICNDPKNEKIYQTSGIPFCSGEGITAQMLVRTVLVKKEEKTCQEN